MSKTFSFKTCQGQDLKYKVTSWDHSLTFPHPRDHMHFIHTSTLFNSHSGIHPRAILLILSSSFTTTRLVVNCKFWPTIYLPFIQIPWVVRASASAQLLWNKAKRHIIRAANGSWNKLSNSVVQFSWNSPKKYFTTKTDHSTGNPILVPTTSCATHSERPFQMHSTRIDISALFFYVDPDQLHQLQ